MHTPHQTKSVLFSAIEGRQRQSTAHVGHQQFDGVGVAVGVWREPRSISTGIAVTRLVAPLAHELFLVHLVHHHVARRVEFACHELTQLYGGSVVFLT